MECAIGKGKYHSVARNGSPWHGPYKGVDKGKDKGLEKGNGKGCEKGKLKHSRLWGCTGLSKMKFDVGKVVSGGSRIYWNYNAFIEPRPDQPGDFMINKNKFQAVRQRLEAAVEERELAPAVAGSSSLALMAHPESEEEEEAKASADVEIVAFNNVYIAEPTMRPGLG